jgi:sirohydrochlorin cobaltochelatase
VSDAEARCAPRTEQFPEWLAELPTRVGELFIDRGDDGTVRLCHRDDVGRGDLKISEDANAALEIARYDDAGVYRPLKTAPNLRHGWMLVLPDTQAAALAVDFFYPGRAAAYAAWRNDELRVTPFRETLARQSGMYRIAAKITDEQADALIGNFCRSDGGCLRTILWPRDSSGTAASTLLPEMKFDPGFDQTGRAEHALPLLCQESCNLLVAAARDVVKSGRASAE